MTKPLSPHLVGLPMAPAENGYDDDKELIEILDLLVFQNSAMKEFKQNYNAHAA